MQVVAALQRNRPDIVINCIGKTGTPNVDWCEDHKVETFRSNVLGPLLLAEECRNIGAYLVHFSSGCVYSGDNGGKGFSEDDPPNFQGSYYSRTKQWTDAMLNEFSTRSPSSPGILMLRIRMPFEEADHPKNLLTKLAKFTKVIDVPNSISFIPDVLSSMEKLIEKRATGIWNVVNPEPVSLFDVACRIAKIRGRPAPERLTESQAVAMTKVPRSNCVLSTEKLKKHGIVLLPTMQRIDEVIR